MDNVTASIYANMTLEEYLLLTRGPKHLSLTIVLPITIVYCLIFATGVVGNVAVCLVIYRHSSMRTATNYYLISLSVSDLVLLVFGLPNDIGVYWQQYPWLLGECLCKLRTLVSEMTSYTSVLTIVAFSIERYVAICHPLHSYTMSNLSRSVRIIAVLWLVSLISAMPFAFFTTINYVDFPPASGNFVMESAFCAMLDENVPPSWPLMELSSFVFFLVPMIVIFVLYVLMGLRIRRRKNHALGSRFQAENTVHCNSKTKAILRMLAAVVIAFFLCWAPFHAQRLLYIYAKDSPYYHEANEWMYYIAGCFYYFSSTVNPILYNAMSAKYRTAFRRTLCRCGRSAGSSEEECLSRDTSTFKDHAVRCNNRSRSHPKASTYHRENSLVRESPSAEFHPRGKTDDPVTRQRAYGEVDHKTDSDCNDNSRKELIGHDGAVQDPSEPDVINVRGCMYGAIPETRIASPPSSPASDVVVIVQPSSKTKSIATPITKQWSTKNSTLTDSETEKLNRNCSKEANEVVFLNNNNKMKLLDSQQEETCI